MKISIQWLILTVILLSVATSVMAQQGVLAGKITDAESGQPLGGATVQIIETKKGTYSGTKGEYRIKNLANGFYTVKISFVGYEAKIVEKLAVQGEGEFTVTLDVVLNTKQTSAKEVVVEAERINDNQAAILLQRQKAATVGDGISKEEISKLSDADAGQALKRVTGVTLVEGKYVYVRGVSDRYSSTTLNGSTLTTTEPDKRSFAFDMFPADLLENVSVTKSFTPDLPGNFVGGLVQMNTVDFPSEYSIKVTAGIKGNDYVTLQPGQFVTYPGGSSDWLGLDRGWRAAPAGMPGTSDFAALRSQVKAGNQDATNEWIAIGTGFNNSLFQRQIETAPFAGKGSVSLQNVWDVAEESRVGLVASLNYGTDYSMNRMFRAQLLANGDEQFSYAGSVSGQSTNVGALANISYQIGSQSSISLKNNYTISSDDESVYQFGHDYTQSQIRKNLSFQFVEKQLLASTLTGEHNIDVASNLLIDWRAGYSQSRRNEPDFRRLRFQKGEFADPTDPMEIALGPGGVTTQGSGSDAGRFYSVLNEYSRNLGLNATLSVNATKIKVGGLYEFRNRDFIARSYTYVYDAYKTDINYSDLTYSADSTVVPDPSKLFVDSNYSASRIGVSEDSRKRDSYMADESLYAGYAMVDYPFQVASLPVRIIGGARIENSLQRLNSFDENDAPVNVNLDIVDVLPSINIVLTPLENFNVRVAASQTLTRPSLREFAPFTFYDFQSQSATQGYPGLTRALVQNYDLRFEYFPGPGEVLSVSGFYKNFLNAIEETIIPGSQVVYTFRNATGNATNYGVELEMRKNLSFVARPMRFFVVSANVALINSEITVQQVNLNDTRQMWGQSPYTVNVGLSYYNPDWGTTISAGYNTAGRRIIKVSQLGVYQIPADLQTDGPHIYENPRDVIDVSVSQAFGNFEMKASVKDLLNQPLVWEQIGRTVASNVRGVGYSFTIGYRFN